MKTRSLLLCGWLLLAGLASLRGQDFHYSQFANAPLHLSPGLTGVFGGNTRLTSNFRSQWSSVPVKYRTFSVGVDHKYDCGRSSRGYFSSGLDLNYDRAGDSRLTWANVGLYGSYTYPTGQRTFLTFGLQAGLGQRSFDPEDLRFGNQFDPFLGIYDPTITTGENFANTSHLFFDLGTGLNFRWQALNRGSLIDLLDKRSKLDVGIGVHHLNRPDMSFIEDAKVRLPIRTSAYANATLQLNDPLDLRLGFTAQFQGPYREYVAQGGLNIFLNREPGQQWMLMAGVGYRFHDFGDAFYPALELEYHNTLRVGVSYDINVSDFNVATDRRGGLELNVRYLFRKVCPLPEFKFCPLL
ncbi:MAG: PorP/SprF family type IX secretion system membrane protein [Lewinella sp.]|nr:PorP/SprF family type IX secretion system membrane protein [Lewinella sp.]